MEIEGYLPKAPLPDSPKNLEVVKVHCEEKEKKNLLEVLVFAARSQTVRRVFNVF